MKIGILGGSFDPPHIAHAIIARTIKEKLDLDEVWLMPCYGHTFNKKLSPVKDRLAMSMFLEESFIKVSDFEITTRSQGYTIQTLRSLQKIHPKNTLYWIMGSDQLENFHTWGPDWTHIFTDFQLIVYPRETLIHDLGRKTLYSLRIKTLPTTVTVLDQPNIFLSNISSTMIRERVEKNLSIRNLVPQEVEFYIKKQSLYTSK